MEPKLLRHRTFIVLIFSLIVAIVAYFLAGKIPLTFRSLRPFSALASVSTLALFAKFPSHSTKTMSTKAPVYFVSHGGVSTCS